MKFVYALIGIVISFVLIKYRETIGDMFGNPDWTKWVGGVYNFIVIIGVITFFGSVAVLTGTERIFFAPLFMLIPGLNNPGTGAPVPVDTLY